MTYCELLAKKLLGESSKSECEAMEFVHGRNIISSVL